MGKKGRGKVRGNEIEGRRERGNERVDWEREKEGVGKKIGDSRMRDIGKAGGEKGRERMGMRQRMNPREHERDGG